MPVWRTPLPYPRTEKLLPRRIGSCSNEWQTPSSGVAWRRRRSCFFESMIPMNFLGSQALHFMNLIIELAFSANEIEQVARLLEQRDTDILPHHPHRSEVRHARGFRSMTTGDLPALSQLGWPAERDRRHGLWQHDHESHPDRKSRRRVPANVSRRVSDDGRSAV